MSDRSPTVLVMDDDHAIRLGAQAILEHVGFSVLVAGDGREGVEIFAQHTDEIDVVLLDLNMPVMSGEEALKELLRIRPEARIVLVSGHDEVDAVERFDGMGLSGLLMKPFDMGALIAKVNEVLEQP